MSKIKTLLIAALLILTLVFSVDKRKPKVKYDTCDINVLSDIQ